MRDRKLASGLAISVLALSTLLNPVAEATTNAVLVAAGDIATCGSADDTATAKLVEAIPGTVLPLGDNAYPSGSAGDYANCYTPTWGRPGIRSRTRPVPGNHEYIQRGASPYFRYFGAAAGDPKKGYYSYTLGTWHLVALNSNCGDVGGCGAGSPMERWLKADLAASGARCILAYWHHPRFFSPAVYPGARLWKVDTKMSDIWRDLQAAGADAVLSGHRHVYERFARQDATGHTDPSGVRQFVVGTGGGLPETFKGKAAHSEARQDHTFGVLQLTLHDSSYDWRYLPTSGGFTDSGTDSCG